MKEIKRNKSKKMSGKKSTRERPSHQIPFSNISSRQSFISSAKNERKKWRKEKAEKGAKEGDFIDILR